MVDLEKLIKQQKNWSEKTFGDGKRTEGICRHIEKELAEIRAKPQDITEWIDVILLAIDGAWRSGHTASQVVAAMMEKMQVNRMRRWNVGDQDEPCEHLRDEK